MGTGEALARAHARGRSSACAPAGVSELTTISETNETTTARRTGRMLSGARHSGFFSALLRELPARVAVPERQPHAQPEQKRGEDR
jgi:hypothetical protein